MAFAVILVSCNKLSPAGFWKGFDSDHIIKSASDQGPWGGTRTIAWKNRLRNYNSQDVIRFAEGNGWRLLQTMVIDTIRNKKISIRNEGNKTPDKADLAVYGGNTEADLSFSGCVNGDCTLYEFNSGWTYVTEGEAMIAKGYVLVDANKHRMTMFHSWGEW